MHSQISSAQMKVCLILYTGDNILTTLFFTEWKKAASLIHQLMNPEFVTRSYTVLCDLAFKLYHRNYLFGFFQIADGVLTAIHGLNDEQFSMLNGKLSFEFVQLVFYADYETANPNDRTRILKLAGILHRSPLDLIESFLKSVASSSEFSTYISEILKKHPASKDEDHSSNSRCVQP